MEKTKTSRKKPAASKNIEAVRSAYQQFYLENSKRPESVFAFCKYADVKEADFYGYFTSLESLEAGIWQGFITDTLSMMRADNAFNEFSAREKVLTFYFALAEVLKSNRSYILLVMKDLKITDISPRIMNGFMKAFKEFINQVMEEGVSKDEIAKRPLMDTIYPHMFSAHMNTFLLYWRYDESVGFEKSDVYIEKSVNLVFDMISKGVVDAAVDLGKFLYQTKVRA
jgi:AcrR family transcriptional regulator